MNKAESYNRAVELMKIAENSHAGSGYRQQARENAAVYAVLATVSDSTDQAAETLRNAPKE